MLLEKEIEELEKAIASSDVVCLEVSKKGVNWHVDHTLRVIIGICKSLHKSNPQEYSWRFNLSRAYVLTRGSIPRGIGKAPEVVSAPEKVPDDKLHAYVQLARELVVSIEDLPPKSFFKHGYFGKLKKNKCTRFLSIHTEHHLKIIRDILRDASGTEVK